MNKVLKSLCLATLCASVAVAGEKDLEKIIQNEGIYVETAKKGIVLSGYVDTSYTLEFSRGTANNSAGSLGGRSFDQDSNDFNIHAFKLALEKALPDSNDFAAGFRADLIFGEDAKFLNDPGVNLGAGNLGALAGAGGSTSQFNDGYALEQAYVQFRIPWGNGLDVKFGKFVTLLGYEVIESPANLNFSRGLLFTLAIPLTHTGVLASYKFNDVVDAQFGLVNGWNNSDSYFGDSAPLLNDSGDFGKAITGRLNITAPGGNANIAQSFILSVDGEGGTAALGDENETVFVYDIWGNWAPKFANDKLLLGFNVDLGFGDDLLGSSTGIAGVGPSDTGSTWYGAALYAKYQFTKVFSLAGRAEYFHSSNEVRFGTGAPVGTSVGSVDLFSWTLTAGFDIWENLLTRVEYRADWGDGIVFDGGFNHSVALNLVYSF